MISQYIERPTNLHLDAVKHICRYVKGILHYGLVYSKEHGNYILSRFFDSNLAGNMDDRKSTGEMAFYLDENLINWVSQKQRCVALSSCEAEFMAATAAACQVSGLQRILSHIMDIKSGLVTLYIDNCSAVDLAKNPMFHGRSEQRADILTKALAAAKFEKMRMLLGVQELGNV
ncbi:secreted RxLR effector protein 161-like [Apium graveolens]|uniref:secreted RxLR effector protein 161-like n=1 Tax=Apium graveolens TaxID=4045 RepID=UPI003D79BBD6